jgi:DNA sulfur modification protein DndE
MLPKRMHISKTATEALRILKGRTGLTPNIACRVALVKSLEEGKEGGLRKVDLTGSEFNAPTLFGEQGDAIGALVKQVHGLIDQKQAALVIASHIEHGLEKLRRARSIGEFLSIAL